MTHPMRTMRAISVGRYGRYGGPIIAVLGGHAARSRQQKCCLETVVLLPGGSVESGVWQQTCAAGAALEQGQSVPLGPEIEAAQGAL